MADIAMADTTTTVHSSLRRAPARLLLTLVATAAVVAGCSGSPGGSALDDATIAVTPCAESPAGAMTLHSGGNSYAVTVQGDEVSICSPSLGNAVSNRAASRRITVACGELPAQGTPAGDVRLASGRNASVRISGRYDTEAIVCLD